MRAEPDPRRVPRLFARTPARLRLRGVDHRAGDAAGGRPPEPGREAVVCPCRRAQPSRASGLRSRHSLGSGGAGTHRPLGFSAGFRGADGMSPASVSSHSVLERTADTEPAMNIYDPSEYIRYVHLSGAADAPSTLVASTTACSPLPSGYANQSPRTRLQRQPAQRRGGRAGVVSLTA